MFERWKRAKEAFPQVEILTQWDRKDQKFYAPGALIRVTNGRGLLCERYSEEPSEATYCTLMFGEQPLFQFQGNEYYCPTCEKIVRSGYGLQQTEEFRNEGLNQEHTALTDALEELKPLLGLLEDNAYVILDTELYPTDGNGHLFWEVPDSGECLPGSCLFYRGDGEWGYLRPHFTVATQSPDKLQENRVEYYRTRPGCRAVAYYMDGYMTALIDGHHKTMAAALEHRRVKALVIMPCWRWQVRQEDGSFRTYAAAGEMRFACDRYGLTERNAIARKKATYEEMQQMWELIPVAERELPYDGGDLAAAYPSAEEMADIDACGEITDQRLDRIVSGEHTCSLEEIQVLMNALGGLRHERLFELADYFLEKCPCLSWLRVHDTGTFGAIVRQLLKLPRSDRLEAYLLNLMVEYEEEYPFVTDRIAEWL